MGDMLSQAEIDALLGTPSDSPAYEPDPMDIPRVAVPSKPSRTLTDEEKDILGEVGNISMGTSATTLFALLNQKVDITTPNVQLRSWNEISEGYDRPCVGIRVDYTEGIRGSNVLILKDTDVKTISSLMMGGDGKTGIDEPLNELDLSAISEAMNQMIGSSSTSLSQLIKMRIDIATPVAFQMDFTDNSFLDNFGFSEDEMLVCVSFRMEIGDLVDSGIMQVLPLDFAIDMVGTMRKELFAASAQTDTAPPQDKPYNPSAAATPPPSGGGGGSGGGLSQAEIDALMGGGSSPPPQQAPVYQPPQGQDFTQQPVYQQPQYGPPPGYPPQYAPPPQGYYAPPPQQQAYYAPPPQVEYKQAEFKPFDVADFQQQKNNIGILSDVPLELQAVMGNTTRRIKEILELSPGSIIEFDKLAGEPFDIVVNGKFVGKGEVIVIDENFGLRVTEIISPEERV